MASLDTSSASAVLKQYYSNQRVIQLTYEDAPLYAMIKKVKDFAGLNYPLPMRVTNPQGRSNTFANAQAQKVPSNFKTFTLSRASDYSLASISTEAILASETDPGAFLKLATAEIDGALESLKRSLQWALYGDGSGALAAIASVSSANPEVLTLSNVEDVVRFEIGQLIEARNGATTRVFATGRATASVTAVDRDLGTVTLDVDNSGNTDTIVAGDTVNVVGDYNKKLTGLAGWIPASAPSATPFFGVDRSIDPTRLAGVRIASTGKPLDEALIDGARRSGREGGNPDKVFMSYAKYADLEKTLGSKIRYGETTVAGITFKTIELPGPKGTMQIIPDKDCPDNRIYGLKMDTWALYSLKEPVMIVDLDGNKMLREGAADAFEVRCASYSQMGCNHPGANFVLTFS
jgi:hypothetical protein